MIRIMSVAEIIVDDLFLKIIINHRTIGYNILFGHKK